MIAQRLLIATTDHLSRAGRSAILGQEKPVVQALLSDLLTPAPRSLKRPRPHQRETLDAIQVTLAAHPRAQAIMAAGTGKTLVALWTHEELASERTLVLMPSLSLVKQTIREWTSNADPAIGFTYIAKRAVERGWQLVRRGGRWVKELIFPKE